MTEVKRRNSWRMCCDVREVTELCSFSNLSVTSPTSQDILQPFRRFTSVTAHSPTLPLFHLRQNSFSNPSFASSTSQALHLRHLASRPWPTDLHKTATSSELYKICYSDQQKYSTNSFSLEKNSLVQNIIVLGITPERYI